MGNPAAGAAEIELRADPRRSDAIIAAAARCTAEHVGRVRRRLTASGAIAHIPPASRAARVRAWRPRPPRQAIEAGATTTAEVMALAGVSYGTAWRALDRARQSVGRPTDSADAAAATDALRVVRRPAPPVGTVGLLAGLSPPAPTCTGR
jgi:hypothetical protein